MDVYFQEEVYNRKVKDFEVKVKELSIELELFDMIMLELCEEFLVVKEQLIEFVVLLEKKYKECSI